MERICQITCCEQRHSVETADLSAVARFKLPDAIHLVSAVRAGCRFFVSADKDFDKLPQGMVRVDPNEDSLLRLMEALP